MEETKTNVTAEQIKEDLLSGNEEILKQIKKQLREVEEEDLLDVQKLVKLGFRISKNAVVNRDFLKQYERENVLRSLRIKYEKKYPGRFFVKEVFTNLNKKYGLIMGAPTIFTGEIPKKNMKELLNFEFDLEDVYLYSYRGFNMVKQSEEDSKFIFQKLLEEERNKLLGNKEIIVENTFVSIDPYRIIATPGHFYLENGSEIIEGQIVNTDPIVCLEVFGGYIYITSWDEEALLFNQEKFGNDLNNN